MSADYTALALMDRDDGVRRLGGNQGLYNILLKKFTAQNNLETLDAALAENNLAEAAASAHTVKGLAANLSLPRLQAVAAELEQALKGGAKDDELLTVFRTVYTDTLAAVAE